MRALVLILATALVAGCASERMPTRSGRPEVTIRGRTTEELKVYFVTDLGSRGYTVRNADPAAMIFEKQEKGSVALLVIGERDRTAWNRVKVSIVSHRRGSHRVICQAFLVGNRGRPVERVEEVSGEWETIQAWLERAKANLEPLTPDRAR